MRSCGEQDGGVLLLPQNGRRLSVAKLDIRVGNDAAELGRLGLNEGFVLGKAHRLRDNPLFLQLFRQDISLERPVRNLFESRLHR